VADELDTLAERPSWTVTAGVATYQPQPDAWRASVRAVRVPGRAGDRWHVAIIDPTSMARYTTTASTIGEAARVAEANVRGRNQP
jgi:hypothetical protein